MLRITLEYTDNDHCSEIYSPDKVMVEVKDEVTSPVLLQMFINMMELIGYNMEEIRDFLDKFISEEV